MTLSCNGILAGLSTSYTQNYYSSDGTTFLPNMVSQHFLRNPIDYSTKTLRRENIFREK